MKKLVFTVTTDLTYDQRMQRICSSLAMRGYSVTLIGRQLPGSKPLTNQPFEQQRLICRFNKGKLFYLEFMLRLWWHLRKSCAHAYCAIDLDTALPVYLTARSKKKPFGYDAHEYFPEVIEIQGRPLIKKIWLQVEKFIVPRTQFAYTVTHTIANLFGLLYGVRFGVVRNTTLLQENQDIPANPQKYFIYQGAVNEGRGLEQILEAMTQVNARLLICGQGDLLEQMKQRAAELGLENKVHFKGYVLPKELQELTLGAWAGLNLLENKGLSYYYSLANKFFDYVHAGIPQLCAPFPEYQQLNSQHRVALLTSLNPAEIAHSLNQLLDNNALYSQLSANCQVARLEWNWQNEEQKLFDIFNLVAPLHE